MHVASYLLTLLTEFHLWIILLKVFFFLSNWYLHFLQFLKYEVLKWIITLVLKRATNLSDGFRNCSYVAIGWVQHLKTSCRNGLPLIYISIQLLRDTRCIYTPLCRKTLLCQRQQSTQIISTQNADKPTRWFLAFAKVERSNISK